MGVIHARVDERLIHGQVATVWTNLIGANRIIVVNDTVVHDKMQIGALKLAKPTGVKLSILSVRKGIENIKSGKYDEDKAFLITRNIQDMRALIDGEIGLTKFNIGNISSKPGSISIKKSVALTEQDIDDIKHLINNEIQITAQMLPGDSDASIETFLK